MERTHSLNVESDNGGEILFVCNDSECRRRLVLKRSGDLVVIDRGDFFARHAGGTGPLRVSAELSQ